MGKLGSTHLSTTEKKYIKELYEKGYKQYEIASMTGRGYSTINRFLNGKTYVNKNNRKGRPKTRKEGLPTKSESVLLMEIKDICDESAENACGLTNTELTEKTGIVSISTTLTALAKNQLICRETRFYDGSMLPVRKIWVTEKGIEAIEEMKEAERAKQEAAKRPIKFTEADIPTPKMVDDRVVILNDILQALRHLTDRIDAIAQIGYDQRDKEIVYAKAQLDKLSSISATIHKEEKE